jgi:hypothetical protein
MVVFLVASTDPEIHGRSAGVEIGLGLILECDCDLVI